MRCDTISLGELVKTGEVIIKTGPFGTQLKASEYVEHGTPVLNVKNLGYATVIRTKLDRVGPDTLSRLDTHILHSGDIVFGRKGAVDRHAFISDEEDGWMQGSDCIRLRILSDRLNARFLSYYFLTTKHRSLMISMCSHGTTMASLNQKILEQIKIPVPKRITQDHIVEILSVLDDKIKLNQQINKNLQQQTQIIFSEWHATYKDKSSEVSLGEICEKVTDGSHFSPKDDPRSAIPMLSVKDMGEFDFNLSSCKHISEEDYQKMVDNDCVPQVNDILVAKDGSYLKQIFICNEQRQLAILSSIAIFRPDVNRIQPEILLAFLKSPLVLQEVRDNYVSGSALPRIVLKDFKKLCFLLPNLTSQKVISPLLSAIRAQIAINEVESRHLTTLRNALLTKLMSGEIDVSAIQL